MNRRFFLGAMAKAPAVSAIASRALTDKATADLAGISLNGMTGYAGGIPAGEEDPTTNQWQRVLANTIARREIESMLYEQERIICRIDPDLAAMRSFSLAAKVTFQRQRNVKRELDYKLNGNMWGRVNSAARRLLGVFG